NETKCANWHVACAHFTRRSSRMLQRVRYPARMSALTAALLVGAIHCSAAVSAGDGGSTDSGTDAVTSDTGGAPPCPTSLPSAGAACSREGLVCGYGDNPQLNCRPTATCTSGAWVLGPMPGPGCEPLPPAMCPATREQAANQSCSPDGAICGYGGLGC